MIYVVVVGLGSTKMVSSWKRFYKDRRGHYKNKFPFLKDDQIAAKMKRVWDKEKKLSMGEFMQ